MKVIEVGDEYIDLNGDVYYGDIYDSNKVFDFFCNFLKQGINFDLDVVFILNSEKVFSKEGNINNISREFEGIIPKGKHTFTYEEVEDGRTILYAAPTKMIKLCNDISKKFNLSIIGIDHFESSLIKYINKKSESETDLLINFKSGSTVFSVVKDGVLKLQTTIKNNKTNDLPGSASRIIKYYSDKNKNEHIKKIIVVGNKINDSFEGEEISQKLSLATLVISREEVYESYEKGQVDFGINTHKPKKVKTLNFTIITVLLVFILIIIIPSLKGYLYIISQKKEIQGDFDAISDILWIMDAEKEAKEELEIAKKYEAIVDSLPEDVNDIRIKKEQDRIIITGNYITDLPENSIIDICEGDVEFFYGEGGIFEIVFETGCAND